MGIPRVGATYNHWVVLDRVTSQYWKCRCVCGAEEVIGRPWASHAKKSCGCRKEHWRAQLGQDIKPTVPRGSLVHYRQNDKMLCGLQIHRVCNFTNDLSAVSCTTCKKLLIKKGLRDAATNIGSTQQEDAGSDCTATEEGSHANDVHPVSDGRTEAKQRRAQADQRVPASV